MQHPRLLLLSLLAAILACASAHGQTVKALSYNTTNGQVIYSGTNVLTFGNASFNSVILPNGTFVDEAQFSAPQFAGALFSFEEQRINQNGVNVIQWDTNGSVTFGNAATTRTNLGLGATWLTNTNVSSFNSAIGLGISNNVQFAQVIVTKNDLGTGFYSEGGLLFESDGTNVPSNVILFSGDQSELLRSRARTNLGLGLPALTNISNVTMMRALAGSTNTNEPYSGYFEFDNGNQTYALTVSNGIILKLEGPF